jgi:hypothetical protein
MTFSALSDSLDRLLNKSGGQKFNDMISGWLPGKDIAETLTDRFSELDKSLTGLAHSGSADQAAAGFRKIAEAAAAQKIPVDQLLTLFPTYYAALKDQATQLGVTGLSAQQYADWMGGKVPGAVRAAEVAAGSHAGALGGESDAMLSATDRARR